MDSGFGPHGRPWLHHFASRLGQSGSPVASLDQHRCATGTPRHEASGSPIRGALTGSGDPIGRGDPMRCGGFTGSDDHTTGLWRLHGLRRTCGLRRSSGLRRLNGCSGPVAAPSGAVIPWACDCGGSPWASAVAIGLRRPSPHWLGVPMCRSDPMGCAGHPGCAASGCSTGFGRADARPSSPGCNMSCPPHQEPTRPRHFHQTPRPLQGEDIYCAIVKIDDSFADIQPSRWTWRGRLHRYRIEEHRSSRRVEGSLERQRADVPSPLPQLQHQLWCRRLLLAAVPRVLAVQQRPPSGGGGGVRQHRALLSHRGGQNSLHGAGWHKAARVRRSHVAGGGPPRCLPGGRHGLRRHRPLRVHQLRHRLGISGGSRSKGLSRACLRGSACG